MNCKKLSDLLSPKGAKANLLRATGLTRPALESILSGKDFKVSNLEKIAKALGVKIGFLFDEDITVVNEEYNQHGNNSQQAHNIEKIEINTLPSGQGDSGCGEIDVLKNEIRHLQELLIEKERIIRIYEKFGCT